MTKRTTLVQPPPYVDHARAGTTTQRAMAGMDEPLVPPLKVDWLLVALLATSLAIGALAIYGAYKLAQAACLLAGAC